MKWWHHTCTVLSGQSTLAVEHLEYLGTVLVIALYMRNATEACYALPSANNACFKTFQQAWIWLKRSYVLGEAVVDLSLEHMKLQYWWTDKHWTSAANTQSAHKAL